MMIVTHEMRFARSVSSRVFYMDEGGIYEEGTPEQVFENPMREKTRRFIRHLKTMQLTIESAEVDYLATLAKLETFGADAALPVRTQRRFVLAFEELVLQVVLPQLQKQGSGFPIEVLAEHAEEQDKVMLKVAWGGEVFNPLEHADDLSSAIIGSIANEANYRLTDKNEVTLVL